MLLRAQGVVVPALLCLATGCSREGSKTDVDAVKQPAGAEASTPVRSPSAAVGHPSAGPTVEPSSPGSTVHHGPPQEGSDLGSVSRGACRAIAVSGSLVTEAGAAINQGDELDGESWLLLRAGSELTVKDRTSGREYRLRGPGEVLPCRGGREELLLRTGYFESAVGAGARPGSLVLVASPHGHVTYGNGQLRITVTGQKTEVMTIAGSGQAVSSDGVTTAVVSGGDPVILEAGSGGPAEGIRRCEQLAHAAARSAEALVADGLERSELGARAAEQVRQRQAARNACAIAFTLARGMSDPKAQRRAAESVRAADGVWRTIPAKR